MIRTHVAFNLVQYRFRFSVSTRLSVRSATLHSFIHALHSAFRSADV